jgi:hypothetical protein
MLENRDHKKGADPALPHCKDPVRAARSLMRRNDHALLCTHSHCLGGYPAGSLVPFVLTVDRHPVLHLPNVAHHTRDLEQDRRVSLTVTEMPTEKHGHAAKVTLLGDARRVPEDRFPDISRLYFDAFPQAWPTQTALGRTFYWIEPVRVHYAGDFGDDYWLPVDEWFALSNV